MALTGIHYEKWLWGYNSINIQGRIRVLGHCPFSPCHLSTDEEISITFVLSKIWPRQTHIMKKKWLWGYNSVNIKGRIRVLGHCPFSSCHLSTDEEISITFVLSKIWPRQTHIMKKKWLWGYNSVNIKGRIMILVHCPSSHCHLSTNQVSFQSLKYVLSKIWPGQASIMKNKWLRGDNSIHIQGRIMVIVLFPSP